MSSNVTIAYVFQGLPSGNVQVSEVDANFASLAAALNSINSDNTYLLDTSGSANTITVALPTSITGTYTAGLALDILVANTTTTGVPTINLGGLGNKTIVSADGTTLETGEILANQVIHVVYDGTNFRLMSIGGATAITGPRGTFGPPVSGYAGIFAGTTVTGASFGVHIFAGTNSSDNAINCTNAAKTATLFLVPGDGSFTLGNSGGTASLVGTAAGAVQANGAFAINGKTPIAPTGSWGTPTGNGVVSAFPGASATLGQCSQVLAELIIILQNFGLCGA